MFVFDFLIIFLKNKRILFLNFVFHFFCFILLFSNSASCNASHDWGVMVHDDGDSLFSAPLENDCFQNYELDVDRQLAYVRCRYARLRRAGVDTLKLNVFSSVAYFDFDRKKFATLSRLDDQSANFDSILYKKIVPRIDMAKTVFTSGGDPVRVAFEAFRAGGGKNLLSFRISDSHYLQVPSGSFPEKHPYVPKFYLDNLDWAIGLTNVSRLDDQRFGGLMDFSISDVRQHFIDAVDAGVKRYSDYIDGVEIDFTRNPVVFRKDSAKESSQLILDLLQRISALLKDKGGGRLPLIIRVGADVEYFKNHGIDIELLISSGLVDVVVVSELMNISSDINLSPIVDIAKKNKVLVYFGLPARRQGDHWKNISKFDNKKTLSCNGSKFGYIPTGSELPKNGFFFGAAINALDFGVDGFELYNIASESNLTAPWFKDLVNGLLAVDKVKHFSFLLNNISCPDSNFVFDGLYSEKKTSTVYVKKFYIPPRLVGFSGYFGFGFAKNSFGSCDVWIKNYSGQLFIDRLYFDKNENRVSKFDRDGGVVVKKIKFRNSDVVGGFNDVYIYCDVDNHFLRLDIDGFVE